jgi:hypothetical protein
MTLARTLSNRTLADRSLWHASAAMVLSLAALPAAAQSQLWVHQFGSSGFDIPGDAVPDGAGGVYVSGLTDGSLGAANAGAFDAWLTRYDSGGSQLWIRQFGTSTNDRGFAAASDSSGGVYLGGETGGNLAGVNVGAHDAWLARFDSLGNQLWIRQFGTNADDFEYAAAPDGSGGVYVSGETGGSFGGPYAGSGDAWLARYDSAGNQLWVRQLGTSTYEVALVAAPDGSGGVYVGGYTDGSLGGPNAGFYDAWLARYDSAGNQLWVRQLGTSTYDYLGAAAPDVSGGVYVGGTTSGSLGGSNAGLSDAWLARYDGAGNQLWIRQLGSSSTDLLEAAAPDGSGGVHVGGHTYRNPAAPNAGDSDAWFASFDGAGNQVGFEKLGTSALDGLSAISADGSGGVYVSGWTYGHLGGPNAGADDAWLARYDAPCGASSSYCTAKTNSVGCLPSIATSGTPSASAGSGFTISTTSVLDNKFGLYFYSKSGPNNIPFQGGILCAKHPLVRMLPQNSGGTAPCGGAFHIDFNAYVASGKDPALVAGQQVWAQNWSRDPGFAPPNNTSLSDAISFTLCP